MLCGDRVIATFIYKIRRTREHVIASGLADSFPGSLPLCLSRPSGDVTCPDLEFNFEFFEIVKDGEAGIN